MKRQGSILIIAFIGCLIFFDAAQQKYYLDEFDLAITEVTFWGLLQTHFIRWLIWIVVSLPFTLLIKKQIFHTEVVSQKQWLVIGLLIVASTSLSLASISLQSLIVVESGLSEIGAFFTFFLFQKGITFFLATILLALLLYNQSKLKTIEEQTFEIRNLRKNASILEKALSYEELPHLNVKTGYKLNPIPLEDIIWIQSDDYCVKIHTETNTHTLRQSLKSLEEKLAPFRFIRIHRTALLNLNYLDQINFETERITLTNKTEIPYSKSRIKTLKNRIKDIS